MAFAGHDSRRKSPPRYSALSQWHDRRPLRDDPRPALNAKKKRALALPHLTEARRKVSQFVPTPMLARIDAALAELA